MSSLMFLFGVWAKVKVSIVQSASPQVVNGQGKASSEEGDREEGAKVKLMTVAERARIKMRDFMVIDVVNNII